MPPTTITWCDHSINPIRARNLATAAVGHYCEKISTGCRHCYSSALQVRFQMPAFPEQRRFDSRIETFLDTTKLAQVLHRQKPTKYFWCDMSDLFGAWVPDAWIDECLATMALTPHHTHMVLTKRPERMRQYYAHIAARLPAPGSGRCTGGPPFCRGMAVDGCDHSVGYCGAPWPLPNLWVGTSVETQATADARIPFLLQVPAAKHFISYEPALERVNFEGFLGVLPEDDDGAPYPERLDWMIVGGESGAQARPFHWAWARAVRDQCQATDTAFFCKQGGASYSCAHSRKGDCVSCFPPDLQIQEFPCHQTPHER